MSTTQNYPLSPEEKRRNNNVYLTKLYCRRFCPFRNKEDCLSCPIRLEEIAQSKRRVN